MESLTNNIGIVILNYNSYQDTINLVNALQQQTVAESLHIIVVDNASPNASYDYLKPLEGQYKNLVVLQTGENLGYAKGNNVGLHYLDEHIHPEYVAIMNNDIILPETCLEHLVGKYQQLDDPAIIAPKQLDIDEKEVPIYSINTYLDDCLNLFYIFKLFHKRKIKRFKDTTGNNAMQVDLVPGSFMFSSFDRFKTLGFFYPNTFLFAEERFITVAAQKQGWHNYVVLDQTYIHAHSKTINTVYGSVAKFKLLYTGWIEFTRVCRPYGKLKANILKPLMWLSIQEMRFVLHLKKLINN
ncbi:glycosyltransferase family 2 protein [Winogradskyella helgolandensis]|uniref:glycosyltransferase family 2 protein n=1 Tax=Winogradskyella helgolandensis TaxID=2697010 RepID=UPI0015CE920E|nr:glycosyltransferase family 2 protein [Winogradskyella helgolandensis]